MTVELVYVTRRDYVPRLAKLARENPNYRFVAANKSVQMLIEASGLEAINPDTGETEETQLAAISRVIDTAEAICARLVERGVEPGPVALVRRKLMVAMSSHIRMSAVSAHHDAPVSVLARHGPVPLVDYFGFEVRVEADEAGAETPADTPFPFLPGLNAFGAPFVLEMRAKKRLTGVSKDMPRFVRLEGRRDRSFAKATMRNTQQGVRSMFERGKATRAMLLVGKSVRDGELEAELAALDYPVNADGLASEAIARLAATTLAEFHTHKRMVDRFLDRYGHNLRLIVFDSPGKLLDAALAQAARERDIPTVMESHGCIVTHGGGPRQGAANIMAEGGFNWSPDIETIVPRSPTQALGMPADKKTLRINHIKVDDTPEPDAENRPFRILFAPNFRCWNIAILGLNTTCYETYDIAEALCRAAIDRPHWQVDVRIKVTVADKPQAHEMERERGLLPGDIEPLIELAPNIRNSSADSYSQNLTDADVVITEGMTAVMIEALEYRTPVLLMNRPAARVPSLPSSRLADLKKGTERRAAYASSLEEDFVALLERIDRLHKGRPLTDEELRDYCWVDGPRGQPHYLGSLLGG